MLLLLDNFDSFTYNLVDYFGRLGKECHVLRNSVPLQEITSHEYEGIVLSPGPETPKKAGCLMEVLDYYHLRLPILGICLGHQAIGVFFGGKLSKAIKPMHGKISSISIQPDPLFQQLPAEFEVVRYHSLIIQEEGTSLLRIAETHEKELMALKHKELPIWGVQFHPEAVLTQFGLEMLGNWVKQLPATEKQALNR